MDEAPNPLTTRESHLGERLRHLPAERGLTQEGLAELAYPHRNYIGEVERGEHNISLLNIVELAHALRVRPANLLYTLH